MRTLLLAAVLAVPQAYAAAPKAPASPAASKECTDLTTCQARCDNKEAASCNGLGLIYGNGQGVPQDAARSAQAFQKACDLGHPAGCLNLARAYIFGEGVPRDEDRAKALLDKACTAGNGAACGHLADQSPERALALHQRALALFQDGCDGKKSELSPNDISIACYNAGNLLGEGKVGPPDYARSNAFHKRACDRGYAKGCFNVGVAFEHGEGVAANPARAATLYTQACDKGYVEGCVNLGLLYHYGRGVKKDAKRARELVRKGCDAGIRIACENLQHLD